MSLSIFHDTVRCISLLLTRIKITRTVSVILFILTITTSRFASADSYPQLFDSHDDNLQLLLDTTVRKLGLMDAVHRKDLAVALVDLSHPHHPRVADLNGNEMMYAASLPKIGILLAALYEVEQGRLTLTRWLHQTLVKMIRFSSNSDASRVMEIVGKSRVNEILESKPFKLYDPSHNGGIWVGKEYAKAPAFQRDPLHNISHGATTLQVARFYYLLETGQLLTPGLNAEMKEILSKPGIRHKFVKGLAGRNASLFRKSGTWQQWHADSALVETPGGTFIIVALASDPRGGDWLTRLAPAVYDAMQTRRVAAASAGDNS